MLHRPGVHRADKGQSRVGSAAARGVPARAARLTRQILSRLRHLLLAAVAAARAQPDRAARLWGAAQGLREEIGVVSLTHLELEAYDYEGRLDAARIMLGDEAAWEAAFAQGRTMSTEEAAQYALSEEVTPSPESPSAGERTDVPLADRLTPREWEVGALVAQGLTNGQIASELHLSERTIENHVSKILRKLGLASRARVAAWATEQRPLVKSNTD